MTFRPELSLRRFAASAAIVTIATTLNPVFAQHVHGVIEVGVVLEGNTLGVSLRAPLSDLVGFERVAENDSEAERLQEAARMVQQADRMFGIPGVAGCELDDMTIEAPDYMDIGANDDEHDAGHHSDRENSETESGGHSHKDIDVQYVWKCDSPNQIRGLEPRFIDGFHNVETINIQLITPSGMRVLEGDNTLDSIELLEP